MSKFNPNLCALALCVGGVAHAAPAALLPLEAGTYVVSSYKPCEEAPLAGTTQFDGQTFIGPHESQCTSSVTSHQGNTYRVTTECHAHGDGTPEAPSHWSQTVQVESKTRLAVMVHGKPVDYELCPAFH